MVRINLGVGRSILTEHLNLRIAWMLVIFWTLGFLDLNSLGLT